MMHGQDDDIDTSVRIALAAKAAIETLDGERSNLYYELVMKALSESVRKVVETMDTGKYVYTGEYVRKYLAQGRKDGVCEIVSRLLSERFGPLSPGAQDYVADSTESRLQEIAVCMLSASTLEEALGQPL